MHPRILYNLLALFTGFGLLTAVLLFLLDPVASAGPLRFVDESNNHLANAELRLLCYSANVTGHPLADLPAHTDGDGHLTNNLPTGCNYLAALWLRHTQPSGKPEHGPAYWLYATSWQPGSSELLPATGDIKLYDSRPLILFNIVASLAWQPATGSPYLAQLQTGLQEASAYLYDLSEGQMAFGAIRVHADGRHWEGADLRFLAANDYRPTAYMGGIVPAATPYTAPTTFSQTVYAPGAIYLGRYWDGLDAADPVSGAWHNDDAFRTLGHEWGHYALFLYDEYQQTNSSGKEETYCVCPDLPGGACAASAMAYHYTAVALWHSTEHGEPAVCQQTDQWLMHGEADWQTLLRWGDIQGLPGNWLHPPSLPLASQALGITGDLIGRAPGYRIYLPALAREGTAVASPIEPTITLAVDGNFSQTALNALYPQVYLTSSLPTYQGTTDSSRTLPGMAGQITLLGVVSNDRARAYAEQFTTDVATGGRFIYPTPGGSDLPLADGTTLTLTADPWEASLDVDYGMIGPLLTAITVTLVSPDALATPPVVQRCSPDAAIACPDTPNWRQTLTAVSPITWTATFNALPGSSLPKYGLLWVQADGAGEMVRWFQSLGGVGPGHDDGQAPLLDGLAMVAATTAIPGPSNQVMLMSAASYDALIAPLPPGFTAVIGTPLDLDIFLPVPGVPVVLTLFYSQTAVDRLGADETQLELLHFSRRQGQWQWQVIGVSGRSQVLNWLASVPVLEDGIYAVGWRPATPPQANFDAFPRNGLAPLLVNFMNLSEGDFDSSLWDFGDTVTSTLTNPSHVYELPGVYTVTLTVSGPGGNDTLVQPNFVQVVPGIGQE